MKAIRVHEYGGPEVLRHEDIDPPQPAAGEALVKIAASGLNYLDVQYPDRPRPSAGIAVHHGLRSRRRRSGGRT